MLPQFLLARTLPYTSNRQSLYPRTFPLLHISKEWRRYTRFFGGLHILFTFPALKPGNTVLSCSIENVSTVHALVVVQQDNITLCHFDVFHVIVGNIVHFLQGCVRDVAVVPEEHVGFVDLRSSIFEALCTVPAFIKIVSEVDEGTGK